MSKKTLKKAAGTIVGATIGFITGGPAGALRGAVLGYQIGSAWAGADRPSEPGESSSIPDTGQLATAVGEKAYVPKSYGYRRCGAVLVATDIQVGVDSNGATIPATQPNYTSDGKSIFARVLAAFSTIVNTTPSYYRNVDNNGSGNYATSVYVLGEGPWERIENVYYSNNPLFNDNANLQFDTVYTYGHSVFSTAQKFNNLEFEFKRGEVNQTRAQLLSNIYNPDGTAWFDTTDVGTGICYMVVRVKRNQEAIIRETAPALTIQAYGKRIKEIRRQNSPVQYSDGTYQTGTNPALIALDQLRDKVFGFGLNDVDIDFDSFVNFANYCDNPGTYSDGQSVPPFRMHGQFTQGSTTRDILEQIALCTGALFTDENGIVTVKIDKRELSETSPLISADNIVGNITRDEPKTADLPNVINVRYINEQAIEVLEVVEFNNTLIEAEGRKEAELFLRMVQDKPLALELAKRVLYQNRQPTVQFKMNTVGYNLDVYGVAKINDVLNTAIVSDNTRLRIYNLQKDRAPTDGSNAAPITVSAKIYNDQIYTVNPRGANTDVNYIPSTNRISTAGGYNNIPAPTNVVVTSISDVELSVSWNHLAIYTAEILYRKANTQDTFTQLISTNSSPTSINLLSVGEYEIAVRYVNGPSTVVLYSNNGLPVETRDKGVITDGTVFVESQHKYLQIRYADDYQGNGIRESVTKQNEIQSASHSDGTTSNPVQIEVNTSPGYTQSEVIKIPNDFNAGTPELEQHVFNVNGTSSNILSVSDAGGINTNYIDIPKDTSTPYDTYKTCINSLSYSGISVNRPLGGVDSGNFELVYIQDRDPYNTVLSSITTSSKNVDFIVRRLVYQFNNILGGSTPTGIPPFTLVNDFQNKRLLFIYKNSTVLNTQTHTMRFNAYDNGTTIDSGNKDVLRYPTTSQRGGTQYVLVDQRALGSNRLNLNVTKELSPEVNTHPQTGALILPTPVPDEIEIVPEINSPLDVAYLDDSNGYWDFDFPNSVADNNSFFVNHPNFDELVAKSKNPTNNKIYYLAKSEDTITDSGRIVYFNNGDIIKPKDEIRRYLNISGTIRNDGVPIYSNFPVRGYINDYRVNGVNVYTTNISGSGTTVLYTIDSAAPTYQWYYQKNYDESLSTWLSNSRSIIPNTSPVQRYAIDSTEHIAYVNEIAAQEQLTDPDQSAAKNIDFYNIRNNASGLPDVGGVNYRDRLRAYGQEWVIRLFDAVHAEILATSNGQFYNGDREQNYTNFLFNQGSVSLPSIFTEINGKEFQVYLTPIGGPDNIKQASGWGLTFFPIINDDVNYNYYVSYSSGLLQLANNFVNLTGSTVNFYFKTTIDRQDTIFISNREQFINENLSSFNTTQNSVNVSVGYGGIYRSSGITPLFKYSGFNIYEVEGQTIKSDDNYLNLLQDYLNTTVEIAPGTPANAVLTNVANQLNTNAPTGTTFSAGVVPNDATGDLAPFAGQEAIKINGGNSRYTLNQSGTSSSTGLDWSQNYLSTYYSLPGTPPRQTRMTIWFEGASDVIPAVPIQYNGYILDIEIPYKTSDTTSSNAQQIALYIASIFRNWMGTDENTATVSETANSWRVSVTRPQDAAHTDPRFGVLALYDYILLPFTNVGQEATFEPTFGQFITPPIYDGLPTEYTIFSPNNTYTNSFTSYVATGLSNDVNTVINNIITFINSSTNNQWTANYNSLTRQLTITHATSSNTNGNWRIQVNNQQSDDNVGYGNISFNDIGNPPNYSSYGIFAYSSIIPTHVLYTKNFTFNYSQGQFVNTELPTNLTKTFTLNANQSVAETNIDSFFTDNSITVTKTKYTSLGNVAIQFPDALSYGSSAINFIQIPAAIAPKFINTTSFYYRSGNADGYTGNIYWGKLNNIDYYLWNRNSTNGNGGWVLASKDVTLPYYYFPTLNGTTNYTVAQQNRFVKVNAGVSAQSATENDLTTFTLFPNPIISNTLDVLINYNFGIQDNCNTIFGWNNANNSTGRGIDSYTEKGFIGLITTGGNTFAPIKTRITLTEPDDTIIFSKDYWNYTTAVPGHTNRNLSQILTNISSYLSTNKSWTATDNGTVYTVTIPYGGVGIPILKSGALKWNLSTVNPTGTYIASLNPGNISLTSPYTIVQEGGPVPTWYGIRSQPNNTFINSSDPSNFKWLKIPGLNYTIGDANALNGAGAIVNSLNPSYKLFVRQRPQFDFITPSPYQNAYQAIDSTTWIIDTDDLTINQTSTIPTVNIGKNTNTLTGSISIYQSSQNRFLIARDVDEIGDVPSNANALTGHTIYISNSNTINPGARTVVNITDSSTNYEPTRFYTYTASNTTWTEI